MTKQSWRNLPTPQILQPRTMKFAADEICANMLRIAPVGVYDAWAEWSYTPENPAITDAWAESVIADSATWVVPPPHRGREWAQRVAREATKDVASRHENT